MIVIGPNIVKDISLIGKSNVADNNGACRVFNAEAVRIFYF